MTLEELTAENEALKAKNADLTQQAKQLIDDLHKHRGGHFSGGAGKRKVARAEFDRLQPGEQAKVGRLAANGEVQIVD